MKLFRVPAYFLCPECANAVPGQVVDPKVGQVRLVHPGYTNCSISGQEALILMEQTAEVDFHASLVIQSS